jgi:hypothetical protein
MAEHLSDNVETFAARNSHTRVGMAEIVNTNIV